MPHEGMDMKNQYVGDIGDYGKYGLLRYLALRGLRIGVNWYLTVNDEAVVNGNIRGYLCDGAESIYDADVFALLKGLREKNVALIESGNIIPNAAFYNEILTTGARTAVERKAARKAWHDRAMQALAGCELIFADPDIGSAGDEAAIGKGGESYAALGELKQYYDAGKDVVYYCQRARRTPRQWQEKLAELTAICPDARIIALTFRRGTQRSYIFAIHPERYGRFDALINDFLQTSWGTASVGNRHIPFFREELPRVSRRPTVQIGEVCLLTNDVPRLAAFYKRLLEVENGSDDATHQFILSEETSLSIHNDGTVRNNRNQNICLAFTVDDMDRAYEKVLALGARIIEPPTKRPWGAVNMSFHDPDNNVIYFRSFSKDG